MILFNKCQMFAFTVFEKNLFENKNVFKKKAKNYKNFFGKKNLIQPKVFLEKKSCFGTTFRKGFFFFF